MTKYQKRVLLCRLWVVILLFFLGRASSATHSIFDVTDEEWGRGVYAFDTISSNDVRESFIWRVIIYSKYDPNSEKGNVWFRSVHKVFDRFDIKVYAIESESGELLEHWFKVLNGPDSFEVISSKSAKWNLEWDRYMRKLVAVELVILGDDQKEVLLRKRMKRY